MPAEGNRLYLYEALELRAEYDARIKTLRDCLPEARKNRDRLGMYGDDQHYLRTADDFDVSATRESIRALEHKLRVPEILTAILPEILAGRNRRTRSERHGENR